MSRPSYAPHALQTRNWRSNDAPPSSPSDDSPPRGSSYTPSYRRDLPSRPRDHDSRDYTSHHPWRSRRNRTESEERVMPKHFDQPLTCFYWANQGHCQKSDARCWYAHYWTGVVAAAPVKILDAKTLKCSSGERSGTPVGIKALAGTAASETLKEHARKEERLKEREALVARREQEVMAANASMEQKILQLNHVNSKISAVLHTIGTTSGELRLVLKQRREEILEIGTKDLTTYATSFPFLTAGMGLVNAIDHILNVMEDYEQSTVKLYENMKAELAPRKPDV